MKTAGKKHFSIEITDAEIKISENDFLVSKTDNKGIITYFNSVFLQASGFKEQDLIGSNHNIIRHPHMPRVAFWLAWSLIKDKKEFFGFIKNLRADGGYYWVFAYISPDLDNNGNIIGYTSFRRKANESAIAAVTPLYNNLLELEKTQGLEASKKSLEDFLSKKHLKYNKYIINLQKGLSK